MNPHKAAYQWNSGDMRDVLTAVMSYPAVWPLKTVCCWEESGGGIRTIAAITGVEQPLSENPALSQAFHGKVMLRSSRARLHNRRTCFSH